MQPVSQKTLSAGGGNENKWGGTLTSQKQQYDLVTGLPQANTAARFWDSLKAAFKICNEDSVQDYSHLVEKGLFQNPRL